MIRTGTIILVHCSVSSSLRMSDYMSHVGSVLIDVSANLVFHTLTHGVESGGRDGKDFPTKKKKGSIFKNIKTA